PGNNVAFGRGPRLRDGVEPLGREELVVLGTDDELPASVRADERLDHRERGRDEAPTVDPFVIDPCGDAATERIPDDVSGASWQEGERLEGFGERAVGVR